MNYFLIDCASIIFIPNYSLRIRDENTTAISQRLNIKLYKKKNLTAWKSEIHHKGISTFRELHS